MKIKTIKQLLAIFSVGSASSPETENREFVTIPREDAKVLFDMLLPQTSDLQLMPDDGQLDTILAKHDMTAAQFRSLSHEWTMGRITPEQLKRLGKVLLDVRKYVNP